MAKPLSFGLITHLAPSPATALRSIHELGFRVIQIGYDAQIDTPAARREIVNTCRDLGVQITTVFCGFPGESYRDIATIRATVGLVPEATRAERVEHVRVIAEFAAALGIRRVGAHVGFIPNPRDAAYPGLVTTVRSICDELCQGGQSFALETGQETAATLRRFIADVQEGFRDNLRVNFDPANVILYGNDQPLDAFDLLAPWVDEVHCKDGLWPENPLHLGREVPFGEGQVNVGAWVKKMLSVGFRGPLIIERESSGDERIGEILRAKEMLEEMLPGGK